MKGPLADMKRTAPPVAICFVALLALLALSALLPALGSQSPARAARTSPAGPQFGPDIRVNPSPSPTTRKFKNLSMAIDPTDSSHIMSAYEYNDAGTIGSAYSFSTDTGRTWNGAWLLGPWGGDLGLVPFGNPSVGVDAFGNFYYSTQVSSQGNDLNGYCVITSTGGTDWETPVPVAVTSYNEYRDQGYLAVDGRASGENAGSVYLTWRFFGENYDGVWVTVSRDRGATWSHQVQISDDANQYAYGPSLEVASNGWVYAAFTEFDLACMCYPPRLFLDRSTDGGQTWGTDQLMTGQPITATGSLDLKGRELVLLGNGTGGSVRVNHFPSFVVSPTDPETLYAVWNDGRWETTFDYYGNTGRHGDIAFSRSTDGGQTWTEPARVNDDPPGNGIDQWQPQIAIGPGGLLGVTWYDRRDDPSGYLYDIYYSQSQDGGNTWSANQRVSDALSDPMAAPDYKGVGDMGFRSSLVYGPNYALPGWVDGRRMTAQDLYTDPGLLPSLTPTTTPGSTATATTTPTPSPGLTPSSTPTMVSTSTPTVTPVVCNSYFTDVQPSDYFYQAVTYLSCHGAISGYS